MRKAVLFTLTATMLIACSNQDKINLELTLDSGYEATYVYETSTEANQMGTMEDISEITYSLIEVTNEGNYKLAGEVTRIKYNSTMFGETESFDSNDPVDNGSSTSMELFQDGLDLLNRPFTLEINKKGETVVPPQFDDGGTTMFSIKDFSNCPVNYPENEVGIGDSWIVNSTNPMSEQMKIETTYTVKEMNDTEITLTVDMKMDSPFGEDNHATGSYQIDRKTGQFITGERTMEMQMGGGSATHKIYKK